MNIRFATYFFVLAAISPSAVLGADLSAVEVKAMMDDGAKIRLVDIRPTREYENGHIPGAINVPLSVLEVKRMPRLGEVVVYGDGLGRNDGKTAVEALNRKPGIHARHLRGGLAAWESAGFATTHGKGLSPETVQHITYHQLLDGPLDEVVLVDIRNELDEVRPASGSSPVSSPPLSDLRRIFPGARVVEPGAPGGATAPLSGERGSPMAVVFRINPQEELTVIIDNGDGVAASELARKMRGQGNRRVVVLAGGEEILRHGGRSGMGRMGGNVVLPTLSNEAPPDPAY